MKVPSHKTQIQALLADIDGLLGKTGGRLSWVTSNVAEYRQILERVREYLVSLDSELEVRSSEFAVPSDGLLEAGGTRSEEYSSAGSQAQDRMLQTLVQQMGDRFSQLMQPLQAELEMLLSQRQTLVKEIRQLELHRQQDYSLTQQQANQQQMIAEFLLVLSSHLQESLKQQLAQTLANLEAQFLDEAATDLTSTAQYVPEAADPTQASSTSNNSHQSVSAPLHPRARVEQLQSLQSEVDRRIQSLDSTINVVFETLQRNVQTYQQSLSQALEKMHQTGVQGEQILAALVNQMAQQLGQQATLNESGGEALAASGKGDPADRPYFNLTNSLPKLDLPYPGSELLGQTSLLGPQPAVSPLGRTTPPSNINNPPSTAANNPPPNLPLDLSDLDFSSLEATASDMDEINTLIQSDQPQEADATLVQSPALERSETSAGGTESELDLILEQLGLDPTTTTSTADLETRQDADQLPQDDVNELYESLFGFSGPTVTEEQSSSILPAAAGETTAPQAEVEVSALNKSDVSTTDTEQHQPNPPALSAPIAAPIAESRPVEQPESADTISALTDLRWDTNLSEDQPAPAPHNLEDQSPKDQSPNQNDRADINAPSIPQPSISDDLTEEDSYTPASPAENLLAPEESESESGHDILLDVEMLEQLNEDLSNLERPENVKLPATSVQPAATTAPHPGLPSSLAGSAEASSHPTDPTNPTVSPAESDLTPSVSDPNPEEAEKKKLNQTDSHQIEDRNSLLLSASEAKSDDFCASVNAPVNAPVNVPMNTPLRPRLMREDLISTDSWFLGIDVGTTGLSAALSNHSTGELYPLYWSTHDYPDTASATRSFRLPSVAFLPTREMGRWGDGGMGTQQQEASGKLATVSESTLVANYTKHGVLIKSLKPYLKVGIPYNSPATGNREPVLQLNDQQTVSLSLCVSLLSTLLATLNPTFASGATSEGAVMPMATVAATGIEPQTLRAVLGRITAVVFSCPDGWSEQYRFNLREAVLNAQLVAHPEQVLFVEEAIATVLSQLGASSYKSSELPSPSRKRTKDSDWQGGTLVINAGATMTQLAIVDLPKNLQTLAHSDFTLHSLPYAGNAIDQDIICQLLCPQKWQQRWQQSPSSDSNSAGWSLRDGWSWRSRLPDLDDLHWDSLQLDQLDLPKPGEPDLPTRIQLQQRLESSLLGQALLEAAGHLKLILQHEEQFTLCLADRQWNLQRRDLETLVFLPFVRRLNRELNRLLVATGMPVEAVNQVICTGGTASLSAIARWLRQKLPKATIVQDLYRSDRPYACSRVAYGLAMLPLLPQVLEEHRQQYSDYFLLMELLRSLPNTGAVDRPYSLSEIILLLERRGINTRVCQHRLMALLEGNLPPGLVPSLTDACWLTQASQQNLDYQSISAAPLFERQANLLYRPNPQQIRSLRHYLSTILTDTHQKLEEPCAVNFFVS